MHGILNASGVVVANGNIAATNWVQTARGSHAVQYIPANDNNLLSFNPTVATRVEGFIQFHYTIDARMGFVHV